IDEKTDEGYVVSYSTFTEGGHRKRGTLKAKRVILGLPRLALEEVYAGSNALNTLPEGKAEKLWNTLQTTTNQPLAKINLYYDQAWWGTNLTGEPSVGYGPSFSDLPLGSVYPFYATDEEAIAALEYEAWLEDQGKPVPEKLQAKLTAIDNKKFSL